MKTYLLISTILFLVLGIIWSKTGFFNFLIKIILFLIGIIGIIYCLQVYGYLIKIN